MDLRKFFSAFGTVTDACVMFKNRRTRGFGFVKFALPQEVVRVFKLQPHSIHKQTVEVKYSLPKLEGGNKREDCKKNDLETKKKQTRDAVNGIIL